MSFVKMETMSEDISVVNIANFETEVTMKEKEEPQLVEEGNFAVS